jgi:RNA polymerase sigma-70 factor (ECF subfamily)
MELYPDKQLEGLVAGCRKRDLRCQKLLFERYYRRMLAVCLRYSNNTAEAEDMAQEGFIKLFEKIDTYSGKGTFEGWMRRLFVNQCLDALRRNTDFQVSFDASFDELHRTDVEEENFVSLSAEQMLNAVADLPPSYRTVFNLFVLDGFSHKEVAAELSISEGTSKSNLSKAREILKRTLSKLIEHKHAS